MSRASRIRVALLAGLLVAPAAMPRWSGAQDARYSGTVVAVDQPAGTIVVEGMGPWRIKHGVTQLQRRAIGIGPSTEFVRLERASGPGAQDKRPTAVRIDVWEPSESVRRS